MLTAMNLTWNCRRHYDWRKIVVNAATATVNRMGQMSFFTFSIRPVKINRVRRPLCYQINYNILFSLKRSVELQKKKYMWDFILVKHIKQKSTNHLARNTKYSYCKLHYDIFVKLFTILGYSRNRSLYF